jgi:hypothetical protein
MATAKMPHSEHEKHLCYLCNLDFHNGNSEEYKKLIKNAKYYCESCGRSSLNAKNLCRPIEI